MLMQYYDRYLLAGRAEQQADSSAFDGGCSFFVSVNPLRNRGEWVNVTGEDRTNYGWRDTIYSHWLMWFIRRSFCIYRTADCSCLWSDK